MVEVYWFTDTAQKKLAKFEKFCSHFCPLEVSTSNPAKSTICTYFREIWQLLAFGCIEWLRLTFFTVFSLINNHITGKYPHFGDFEGKSVPKMWQNQKNSNILSDFIAKIWHLIQNIWKRARGYIVNHICFKIVVIISF